VRKNDRIYPIIFIFSISVFLLNYLIQGPISFGYSDNYGLITKMSFVYWIGYLGMIILIYYHFTNFKKIPEIYVLTSLSLIVIYFIGTPFFYETLPRFEDSWFHSYLAEQIYEKGKVASTGNIYEQYPGTFLYYGLLFNYIPSYAVMKIIPILFYIIGVTVIFLTFRELDGPRTAFLITILYMFFNWTVEDNHLSPQFLMLNLYIMFMFILIKGLKSKKTRFYWVIIVVMALTFSFSHLFTQIFIILTLGITVLLVKKLRKGVLPVLVLFVVIFLIHETFFTIIMKQFVRDVITTIQDFSPDSFFSSAGSRVGGDTLSRKIFVISRLGILGLSLILGIIGIYKMYKKGLKIESKFIFGWAFSLIPFLVLIFFVSRGEFAERFSLVSSLPLAVGAAFLLNNKKYRILVLVLLLVLSPVYFIAKYGNEAYESKSFQRLRADCYSLYFELECEKNYTLMHSPLDYDFNSLGETHFTVTREEVMAASIYGNYSSTQEIMELIEWLEEERNLHRVYSTDESWSYIIRS